MHTGIMEKVDMLLQDWASQERDCKEKEMVKLLASSVEFGPTYSRPSRSQYKGDGALGNWREEWCVRHLDIPVFDNTKSDA